MRLLTSISGKAKAESLVAYLLTLQISTHVEPGKSSEDWEVWIRDEDKLPDAKRELQLFLENPSDSRYAEALGTAQQIVQQQKKQRQAATKQVRTGKSVFRGGPVGTGKIPPVTLTLLIISAVVTLLTEFTTPSDNNKIGKIINDQLSFVSPTDFVQSQNDPAASLRKGELWRLVTPMFPHGSTLHVLFNFLAMIQLGKIVERMEGSGRYFVLVLATGIFASLFQGLMPPKLFGNPFFCGLSGVVYGAFGFLLAKSMLQPHLGIRLSEVSVFFMLGILILGFTSALGSNIANMAHLGGFVAGLVLAFFDSLRILK
jgi:GlpG protein